jgi:hypothetical protein
MPYAIEDDGAAPAAGTRVGVVHGRAPFYLDCFDKAIEPKIDFDAFWDWLG